MFTDYVLNGQAHGEVGEQFAGCRYEPGLLRPYVARNGKKYVTLNVGYDAEKGQPIQRAITLNEARDMGLEVMTANATTLRKDEWIMLDQAVLKAARQRLRAWADLEAVSSFGGFNGMAKTILEYETMSDPGEAIVDMDGLTPGRTDTPLYQLEGMPLPITHSDFWYSSRRLAVSRNTGTPLDASMAEACGRRVAEHVEKMLIGTVTQFAYGTTTGYTSALGSTVWGYLTHPNRNTKTDVTTPTGTNSNTTLAEVLEIRELLYTDRHYGPFMLYHSPDWDQWLDNDYYVTSGTPNITLRNRIRAIEGITDVRRLDFLSDNTYTLIMVQMTPDVVRAINGMEITTVQWPTSGGMRLNFKVMCIKVPQIRSDYNSRCGIAVGTTS